MPIIAVLSAGVLAAAMTVSGLAAPPTSSDEADSVNSLTADEVAAGWELLFDGTDLEKWRGFRMDRVPDGWSVDDGTIHFAPPKGGEGVRRSDLITRELYGDFELRLEWKITPGGNSGIMFRVTEDHDRTYYTGPEMQILDDDKHRDGLKPETSAGSNYALHAPASDVVRPVGEWNEVRLRVEGPHVEHWLNGQKIVEYELWSDDWEQRVAASKFRRWPRYGRNPSGHVALQDHGNELWFRNLAIRRLGS